MDREGEQGHEKGGHAVASPEVTDSSESEAPGGRGAGLGGLTCEGGAAEAKADSAGARGGRIGGPHRIGHRISLACSTPLGIPKQLN